jgi:hypothetical protein
VSCHGCTASAVPRAVSLRCIPRPFRKRAATAMATRSTWLDIARRMEHPLPTRPAGGLQEVRARQGLTEKGDLVRRPATTATATMPLRPRKCRAWRRSAAPATRATASCSTEAVTRRPSRSTAGRSASSATGSTRSPKRMTGRSRRPGRPVRCLSRRERQGQPGVQRDDALPEQPRGPGPHQRAAPAGGGAPGGARPDAEPIPASLEELSEAIVQTRSRVHTFDRGGFDQGARPTGGGGQDGDSRASGPRRAALLAQWAPGLHRADVLLGRGDGAQDP